MYVVCLNVCGSVQEICPKVLLYVRFGGDFDLTKIVVIVLANAVREYLRFVYRACCVAPMKTVKCLKVALVANLDTVCKISIADIAAFVSLALMTTIHLSIDAGRVTALHYCYG